MTTEGIEGAASKALVIGGGIAGITSALDLANQGHEVYLVERRTSIGGRMAQLDKTFPTLDCSICILAPKMVEVARHPRIHLLTYSEVKRVEPKEDGKYFEVTIAQNPRYVDASKCTGCGICVQNCPSKSFLDEFNEGMGDRKAIYIPFPQAVPRVATIDPKYCLKLKDGKCGVCAKKCPVGAIDFKDQQEETKVEVRSIIVATGYDVMEARALDRYGQGAFKNVISAIQYERLLTASGPTSGVVRRPSDGKEPSRIGMVLCAGSRNTRVKEYCSKICCVYSAKNALLTLEHAPGSEVVVYYNDLRVAGKGHEEFLVRAAQEPRIKYVPSLPGNVDEEQDGSLSVTYVDAQTDKVLRDNFELLVLYTPMIPSRNVGKLANILDVDVNENGFIWTPPESSLTTSREGIFVCGCAHGPEDISNSVAEATAAAALAAERSNVKVSEDIVAAVTPVPVDLENPHIGVYVCSCGSNIAGVIDVDKVVENASALPNVVHAQKCAYACSQDNQKTIQDDIRAKGLDRIVIAACTPRSHLPLFQETCARAGLDRNLVGFVSLRELVSWVHQHETEEANRKAMTMVHMGVSNNRLAIPGSSVEGKVTPMALVIGGGVAGMSAALTIASKGFKVTLVEKSERPGGAARRRKLKDVTGFDPAWMAEKMEGRVAKNRSIEVMTSSAVVDVSGSVGRFSVVVERIGGDSKTLDTRKTLEAGVIIVASGALDHSPDGILGYGKDPRILSQSSFESLLQAGAMEARSVVQVLCADARDPKGIEYCGMTCCETGIRDMIELKTLRPEVTIYVLYRDIRMGGQLERYYRKAGELGINFVRYAGSEPPSVLLGKSVEVKVHDVTADMELSIPSDLVVLSTTLVPNPDNHLISEALKLSLGQDGFFHEAHPKMRPVEFATDGIYVAGSAQGPKGFIESITQGLAAASRALIPLMRGKVIQEPTTATVDQDLCTGCARCVMVCPYSAIGMEGTEGKILAEINQLMCKGCGKCAVACPVRAISIFNFTTDQMLVQIDEALADAEEEEVRGIALLCNWCAYAGADNAGVSRYQYPPNIIPIRTMCTGRIDPFYVLYALLKGADGVLIGGCHPGDCHYVSGNTMLEVNIRNLKEMMEEYGFEPSRVRVEWCSASEGKRFANIMAEFTQEMRRLGPNPNRRRSEEGERIFVGKGVA